MVKKLLRKILMLNYSLITLFLTLNLLIYALLHIPLDLALFSEQNSSHKRDITLPAWESPLTMVLTSSTTLYLWGIFILSPLTMVISLELFYDIPLLFFFPDSLNMFFQFIGLLFISLGTFVACWGRISRGSSAISWGVPNKLVTHGVFRWIRHPLYASYCYYFIGFLSVFQSFLVTPLLLGVYGYYKTSKYEEIILIEHFGKEYIQYQKTTGRFFPFFGILRKEK